MVQSVCSINDVHWLNMPNKHYFSSSIEPFFQGKRLDGWMLLNLHIGIGNETYRRCHVLRRDFTKHPMLWEEDKMKNVKWLSVVLMSVGLSTAIGGLAWAAPTFQMPSHSAPAFGGRPVVQQHMGCGSGFKTIKDQKNGSGARIYLECQTQEIRCPNPDAGNLSIFGFDNGTPEIIRTSKGFYVRYVCTYNEPPK